MNGDEILWVVEVFYGVGGEIEIIVEWLDGGLVEEVVFFDVVVVEELVGVGDDEEGGVVGGFF